FQIIINDLPHLPHSKLRHLMAQFLQAWHLPEHVRLIRIGWSTRKFIRRGKRNFPGTDLAFDLFEKYEFINAGESGPNGSKRLRRPPGHVVVALAHQMKCVFVKAKPDVQAVFLDPIVLLMISAAGSLATQAPAFLIDSNFVAVLLG